MKNRKFILYVALFITLLIGGIAIAANSAMPMDANTKPISVFAPNEVIDVSNAALDVSSYAVIMFEADVTIQFGGTGSTYDWPANTPFGIGSGITSITISGLSGTIQALVM